MRCCFFALTSAAFAFAQPSDDNKFSTLTLIPRLISICALLSALEIEESMVVKGVILASFFRSEGISDSNTRLGSLLPVVISLPPLDTI